LRSKGGLMVKTERHTSWRSVGSSHALANVACFRPGGVKFQTSLIIMASVPADR
jgi:hypothetical protein